MLMSTLCLSATHDALRTLSSPPTLVSGPVVWRAWWVVGGRGGGVAVCKQTYLYVCVSVCVLFWLVMSMHVCPCVCVWILGCMCGW